MGKRIVWADNLKGFLSLLVIVGHTVMWSGLMEKRASARILYFLICSFHMPAFFVIGGYLIGITKGPVTFSMRKSLSRILNLVVPTTCAMIVYAMTQRYLGGVPYSEIIANTWYWFVCVIAAVSVLYPVLCLILRSEVSRLILLLSLFLIARPVSNFVSMFFGYFLCYDFGAALGRGLEFGAIKKKRSLLPSILAAVLCSGIMAWAYCALGYGCRGFYLQNSSGVAAVRAAYLRLSAFSRRRIVRGSRKGHLAVIPVPICCVSMGGKLYGEFLPLNRRSGFCGPDSRVLLCAGHAS